MDDPYKFAGGKENAFLIQNAFPIIAEFFDHIHTVENKPVTVHNELNRILTENLGEVLALYNRGIHLIFTDIDKIRTIMEQEFENTGCSENVSRDTINNNYTHIYNMLYELKKHRKIGYISLDDSRKQNLVEYEEKEQKKIYDTIKTEDIHEVIKFLKRRYYIYYGD